MNWSSLLCILMVSLLCAECHNGNSVFEDSSVSGSQVQTGTDSLQSNKTCKDDEMYLEVKGFCCQKCGPGFRVKADCDCPNCRTQCEQCKPGTFLELQNYCKNCYSCKKCDAVLGQIIKSECTTTKNTVCGCRDGHYKEKLASDKYECRPCTQCNNVLKTCHEFNDTICKCDADFYFSFEEKRCLSCTSCTNGEGDLCSTQCLTKPVVTTKEPPETNHAAVVPAIVFGVAFIVITALFVAYLIKSQRKKNRSFYSQVSETGSPSSHDELVTSKDHCVPSVVTVCPVTNGSTLPDCVRNAGNIKLPNDSETLYKVVDAVPAARWKEFVRRLGLPDSCIERLYYENRHFYREAQYEMIKCWCLKKGQSGATIEVIYKVLTEMDLSGCAEMIQESLQAN
uniref:TNFRSF1A n=1 Tax=Protopterus dolloi TaxID=27779 RepID=A0A6B9DAH2_PRODO|nr:TNFRSF1A [Protopterus dolloi]